MLLIAQMVCEFAFETAFYQGFGELLKKAVLAKKIIWGFNTLQKLIY
jgi:hypothetical protein